MDIKQKLINVKNIFKGNFIKVDQQTLTINKQTIKREIVDKQSAVAILAINNDKILLTKQYRPGTGDISVEIPAGLVDAGETPEIAAKRELLEETGYRANLKQDKRFFTSPGMTNEKVYLFKASDLQKVDDQHLDNDEFLNYEWVSLEKACEMMNDGLITDAKTIIALLEIQLDK